MSEQMWSDLFIVSGSEEGFSTWEVSRVRRGVGLQRFWFRRSESSLVGAPDGRGADPRTEVELYRRRRLERGRVFPRETS